MHSLALLSLLPVALAASADPYLVGYISSDGSYVSPRSCSYPQTASTSGSYFQCCPTTGSCPFYTACSGDALQASGISAVGCYNNPGYTCNTAILLPTISASESYSYLQCWSTELGSAQFTIVQDIGSATAAAASSTGAVAASTTAASAGSTATTAGTTATTTSATTTKTSTASSSATQAASSSSSTGKSGAGNVKAGLLEGGALGVVGYVAGLLI